jgi:hypothetical protein
MSPLTLSPAGSVVRRGYWFSTSYGSARPRAALAPQLTHPFSLLDVPAPPPDGQLVHFNVRHPRTPAAGPLNDMPLAPLKSP